MREIGESFTVHPSGLLLAETADQKHRAKVKSHVLDSLSLLDEVITESPTLAKNNELQVSIFNAIAANLAGE